MRGRRTAAAWRSPHSGAEQRTNEHSGQEKPGEGPIELACDIAVKPHVPWQELPEDEEGGERERNKQGDQIGRQHGQEEPPAHSWRSLPVYAADHCARPVSTSYAHGDAFGQLYARRDDGPSVDEVWARLQEAETWPTSDPSRRCGTRSTTAAGSFLQVENDRRTTSYDGSAEVVHAVEPSRMELALDAGEVERDLDRLAEQQRRRGQR